MKSGDFVAVRQPDGRFVITRFNDDRLEPLDSQPDLLDETETRREFEVLRAFGNC